MKKKIFAILIVIAMSASFFGCSQNEENTSTTKAEGTTTAAAAGDTTKAPDKTDGDDSEVESSGEITKFTFFRDSYNGVAIQGWENMEWMKEWCRRNNVEIEFKGPAAGEDATQATNIMLVSGDYPEVIYFNWNEYSGGLKGAIEDEIVVDLGAKYRDQLPNWFALQDENENIRRAVTLDDGTSALLCHVEFDLKRAAYHGYAIRKDWLDQLDMEVPTTIDELYDFAKAVSGQDMNGDGSTDTYAFTDQADGTTLPSFIKLLGAAWGLRADSIGLDPETGLVTWWTSVDDGKAFTDFTETMAKWYQEGLFDPDCLTNDAAAREAMITSGKAGMFTCYSSQTARFSEPLKSVVPDSEIYGMVPVIGPAGKPYNINDAHVRYAASNEGTCVTVKAEENGSIDAILKFLDYGYSPEGDELINWGEEGVSFKNDGGNRVWTETVTNDPEFQFGDIIVKYAIPTRGGWPKIMSYDAWYAAEVQSDVQSIAHENYWKADTGILVPPIMLSRDEADEYNRIMVDARTMINENFSQFFNGTKPTSEIPAFLEQLNSLNIDRAMELYNDAYERYLNK